MNITKKRYLALLLAVVMIFSTITPNMVFAAGSDTIVYGPEDCELGADQEEYIPYVKDGVIQWTENNGAYVQLNNVNGGETGGEFNLTINYSTGMPGVYRTLYVNGEKVMDVDFARTDEWLWQTYADTTVTIMLKPGEENTIRLICEGTDGTLGLNYKYFSLKAPTSTTPDVPDVETTVYNPEDCELGDDQGENVPYIKDGVIQWTENNGAYVQLNNVNGGENGGEFNLTINYAAGMPGVYRTLYVNGERIMDVDFARTDEWYWNTYADTTVTITLKLGEENTIRLICEGTDGTLGLNYKRFTVSPYQTVDEDGERNLTYEAENALYGGGARVENMADASGGQHVGCLHYDNSYCEFRGLDGGREGGAVEVTFRYSAWQTDYHTDGHSDMFVYVNGEKYEVAFPGTGGWDRYNEIKLTVTLKPSIANTIRVCNADNANGIGLDKISYTVVGKIKNGDGPRYEAEYCELGRGEGIGLDDSASAGAFAEDFGVNGAYLTESHVNGKEGGTFGLTIRYAANSAATKSLYVNGEKAATLSFDATGEVWRDFYTNVTLNAGKDNIITIKNDNGTADVKVDYFEVTSSTVLAYWKLNEKYDATASDASGSGNDAKIVGAKWKPAFLDNGLLFNGKDSYAAIPMDDPKTDGFTVSMWVKPNSTKDQTLFYKGVAGDTNSFSHELRIKNGKFEAYAFDTATSWMTTITGTSSVKANNWYYLTLSIQNGGEMALYVNGNKEASKAMGAAWDGGNVFILGCSSQKTNYFDGLMDEVTLLGGAQTKEEVVSRLQSNLNDTYIDLSDDFDAIVSSVDANSTNVFNGAGFAVSDDRAVSCNGQELTGFEGIYDSLRILGLGGSGALHIEYADRTSEDITLSMGGTIDVYTLDISSEKVIKSITLPENSNMKILAMTLVVN